MASTALPSAIGPEQQPAPAAKKGDHWQSHGNPALYDSGPLPDSTTLAVFSCWKPDEGPAQVVLMSHAGPFSLLARQTSASARALAAALLAAADAADAAEQAAAEQPQSTGAEG